MNSDLVQNRCEFTGVRLSHLGNYPNPGFLGFGMWQYVMIFGNWASWSWLLASFLAFAIRFFYFLFFLDENSVTHRDRNEWSIGGNNSSPKSRYRACPLLQGNLNIKSNYQTVGVGQRQHQNEVVWVTLLEWDNDGSPANSAVSLSKSITKETRAGYSRRRERLGTAEPTPTLCSTQI